MVLQKSQHFAGPLRSRSSHRSRKMTATMTVMDPASIPQNRAHLDAADRNQLIRLELLLAQGLYDDAQEIAEDLWLEANDAHKRLYQGLSNAITAVVARQSRQLRGARQIARQTRSMLEPYPRRAIGIELDALLDSVDDFVLRGEGPILLLRQGG